MTHTISTHMRNELSRRRFLLTGCAAAMMAARPAAARPEEARALVERMVGEIRATIESNLSSDRKAGEIERIIATYADVTTIARSVLGPSARAATSEQLLAYGDAFQGYLARKYTPRFDEFFGGSIAVTDVEPWRSHFHVHAEVVLPGQATYGVVFRVSDRRGRLLVFDIVIAGVSVIKTETVEVRALLDRARGDLNRLTANLRSLG